MSDKMAEEILEMARDMVKSSNIEPSVALARIFGAIITVCEGKYASADYKDGWNAGFSDATNDGQKH